jgi:uncharacterized membrane protein YfcA
VSGAELTIVLVTVVVGATIKAITGMGLPLIVIPVASLFVDVEDAIVVIALPNVMANGILAGRERSSWPATRDLPVLIATGVVGAVGGTLLLVNVPEEPLVVALIVSIVGYVALFFLHPELRTTPRTSRRLAPAVGAVAGVFQGAIGISGPIVGSWIHSYRLPRGAHVLSVTILFFLSGLTQLVILTVDGQLADRLAATLLACVPVLAAIPIGTALRDRVSTRAFDLAIVGILAVSAVSLTVRTFA